MLVVGIAFFLSLIALAWPSIRGVPWRQVRQDIGWTTGRQPPLEPLAGVAGYCMALPLLVVGVTLTLVLMMLHQMLSPPGSPLDPVSGPAHPVIGELRGGWWPRLQVLFLASVAAPIVEETVFRGVLYRHLRDASRRLGELGSFLVSTLVSGFVFAAIHPQGLLAVPALMGLASGFCILREWRGTLIPAMVMHGLSNGLVMMLLMVVLGKGQ
jgi:membrane protease YdiL (CAAX protease family)